MLPPEPTPSAPDPHVAASIARAERGLAMLDRLAVIGMAIAEEIGERIVGAPYHPEPRHDPVRGFAAASRSVRLTLAMVTRVDAEILALRNGALPTRATRGVRPAADLGIAAPSAPVMPADATASEGSSCLRRDRSRDAEREAGDREADEADEVRGARRGLHENPVEREDDGPLSRPWRECVEAIRADLGLDPDASGRSDDENDCFSPARPEATSRSAQDGNCWPDDADISRLLLAQRTAAATTDPPPVVPRQ